MDTVEMLGGEKVIQAQVRSEIDLTRIIENGLPVESVRALARLADLTPAELERIVSRKTLSRLEGATKSRLTPELSDKLARYARVLALAERTFKNHEKVVAWLRRPNRALEGSTPYEMLATDSGARLVETVLIRLAHGVFS